MANRNSLLLVDDDDIDAMMMQRIISNLLNCWFETVRILPGVR